MLNKLLLEEFDQLGIKYEQATWDTNKNKEGKPQKSALKIEHMEALRPFHWAYEFDAVLTERGGFDAIITNPPWETFQPNAKEFFSEFSDLVTKKKMDIKEFERESERLLHDPEIMRQWLDYHSQFNHQRSYFRFAKAYENQVPVIDGKRQGKDVNLYKLFLERVVHLLRENGESGVVIPSGIYTDLGAKKLREMLFAQTEITGLFCFENRRRIFEGVDSRFKFVILSFQKGGRTEVFPAAFMKHEVHDLVLFPASIGLPIHVDLIRRLSPDSLSVMEFSSAADVVIAEKALRYPLLGEAVLDSWQLVLHREFNMTDDAHLFAETYEEETLPLYEGKMIWHFDHKLAEARYWVSEAEGRAAVLGREADRGQQLGYQKLRLAYRSVASNTNERSMISTIIPPSFTGNSLNVSENLDGVTQLVCMALLNSFMIDWFLRQKVTTNINMFYVYQLPIPRLTEQDAAFRPLVERAARLVGTSAVYDDLLKEVFGKKATHQTHGSTDPAARQTLRAEIDALVARLYDLTEDEFTHILSTFPLVDEAVKAETRNTYRELLRSGKLPDSAS